MEKIELESNHIQFPVYTVNTVVVGTGAAGYNAADRLYELGQTDIAIVTEHINAGTSRNTGSDKQTYYKLTLSGGDTDSVRDMAQTLYEGQAVDGDIALCEASLSAQSFLKLVELGVKFPRNRYGEYIGYKTDHDPRRRATSVGPYTSKMMTECLEKSVVKKGIKIFDKLQVLKILTDDKKAYGLLCLNLDEVQSNNRFVVFHFTNIIFATGGPAGMYANSVYPFGHYGATGTAFEAGVLGKNLTEWQYGLASTHPRWNVSGTYMQVMPKFISTNQDGGDEKEFLFDFFRNKNDMLNKVFLKGYQWPFDVRKINGGSSIIDILVYMESNKDRRVYLDFRQNPRNEDIEFSQLSKETYEYLNNANACLSTPIERLLHMNSPAVDFYMDKGVDIRKEPLEIALCAQHNNGGLSIDCWWKTNIEGFFAVGEVSASHGVYRPGGSALNAGQVGSTRAAQYISQHGTSQPILTDIFVTMIEKYIIAYDEIANHILQRQDNITKLWDEATQDMSRIGAAIRNKHEITHLIDKVKKLLDAYEDVVGTSNPHQLWRVFRLKDILVCQYVYLNAMLNFIDNNGKSRGSALYTDEKGEKPYANLPDTFTFSLESQDKENLIQQVQYKDGNCEFSWRKARELPADDSFFETVWRAYRDHGNIY